MAKQNLPAKAWPAELRAFVIEQLATWQTKKDVYRYVTSKGIEEDHAIERLDRKQQNFGSFVAMCGGIPKREIAKAHALWLERYEDVHWGSQKARVQGMSDLLDTMYNAIKETPTSSPEVLAQFRMLLEQMRKEMSADADRAATAASGTKLFLGSGSVEFTPGLAGDLLLVLREEYGGLHNMNLHALSQLELEQLRDRVIEVLAEKVAGEAIDAEYEILDDNEDEEPPI